MKLLPEKLPPSLPPDEATLARWLEAMDTANVRRVAPDTCGRPMILPDSTTMNTAAVGSVSESPQTQIHSWARQTVQEWSEVCQHFLDRQKRCILLGYPSEAERADHRAALKWMLRITRLICATTDDPDYPDKSVASEIRGRLIQLEESWRLTQEQKPEGEAEKILREIFPE